MALPYNLESKPRLATSRDIIKHIIEYCEDLLEDNDDQMIDEARDELDAILKRIESVYDGKLSMESANLREDKDMASFDKRPPRMNYQRLGQMLGRLPRNSEAIIKLAQRLDETAHRLQSQHNGLKSAGVGLTEAHTLMRVYLAELEAMIKVMSATRDDIVTALGD